MVNKAQEIEQIACTIDVMIRKEQSTYQVPDYLSDLPVDQYGKSPIDPSKREAIVNWYLQIVEIFHMSIDTAAIAVSILDRFASSPSAKEFLIHGKKFQLASLAAIYTAVKIHEKEAISPALAAKLSGGVHTKEAIEKMEMRILQTISWRVNPPTAMWFAQSYLQLLNRGLDSNNNLMRSIESQVAHSLLKYEFCTVRPSEIAAAAVLNTLEAVYGLDDALSVVRRMESVLCAIVGTNIEQLNRLRFQLAGVVDHSKVLSTVVVQSNKSRHAPSNNHTRANGSHAVSPKTVITTTSS